MMCPPCNGTGKSPFVFGQYCSICKGRGELPDDPKRTEMCKPCIGTGKSGIKWGEYCDMCGGYGKVPPLGTTA